MMLSERLLGRSAADVGHTARTQPSSRAAAGILILIVALAAALRLHGLPHDLPYTFHGDEIQMMNRAMAMGTGDLNPYWFNKPALLAYLLLFGYGTLFVVGWLFGQFASPEAFGVYYLAGEGPFVLVGRLIVFAFGVATVYVSYLIAKRAFGDVTGALMTAFVCAALLPMVVGSYIIKADVPASFFIALSVWTYLRTRDDPGLMPLALAGAFAGLSMGTKYYGAILLPVFGLAELARPFMVTAIPWPRVLLRGALLVAAFVAGFFIASPYNFLEPVFFTRIVDTLASFVSSGGETVIDPDHRLMYERGLGAIPGALAHALGELVKWDALTWPLAVVVGLGIVSTLARRDTRWAACVLAGPYLVFLLAASTFAAYHANARHLNAVYPLLAAFAFPGALLAVRVLGPRDRPYAKAAAIGLVLLATAPTALLTVQENLRQLRPDSRTLALEWIDQNLSGDEVILLDEHGGLELRPSDAAVTRQLAALKELQAHKVGSFDAFTTPEARRLDLLKRYPIENGFNVERLGHPWWLPRELGREKLLDNPKNWQISNPLVDRLAKPLAEYRAAGISYVITNSWARERYRREPNAAERYPSFVRFYDELSKLEPLKVIDPAEWNGKGPVVQIYDLRETASPRSAVRVAK